MAEREKTGTFPSEVLAGLAGMGILGMMVPEEYGGAGADALSYIFAIEELARVCASTAVIVSVNNSVVCYPIWKFGSERQKTTILRELASGEALGAYALTEPQSGSDAANQKTRAVRDGSGYVLNGAKAWITNAGEAKWYVVMAMTDAEAGTRGITAFLVSSEDPGVRVGAPEDKMGLRASKTASVFLEDVRVPGGAASRRRGRGIHDRDDDARSLADRDRGAGHRHRPGGLRSRRRVRRHARDVRQEARRARGDRVPDRGHARAARSRPRL